MTTAKTHRILCVDDEPQVLEGLSLHLRRHYAVDTATSGAAGLEQLSRRPDTVIVVSDMRMPGMDGAAFLKRAREVAPDAVRILLTGQADMSSAIAAINEGQIFRFLTKPCPPPMLLGTMIAALEQHHLITAERVLLAQTLHGSIKALTDVLALLNPISFGRTMRVKKLVAEMAEKLALPDRWQLEVAAMLSQLGYVTLPPDTAERVYYGQPLSMIEQKQVAALPALTEKLIDNIPRLESVREILRTYPKPYRLEPNQASDPRARAIALGASILRLAMDFDTLESSQDGSADFAADTLCGREGQYHPEALKVLLDIHGSEKVVQILELTARELREGMVLASDVKNENGMLLVARGYEITKRFLERLQGSRSASSDKIIWRVIVQPEKIVTS